MLTLKGQAALFVLLAMRETSTGYGNATIASTLLLTKKALMLFVAFRTAPSMPGFLPMYGGVATGS